MSEKKILHFDQALEYRWNSLGRCSRRLIDLKNSLKRPDPRLRHHIREIQGDDGIKSTTGYD
ncbi:hypothetical protein ACTXT7_006395 [Hymenolepis weldensis]